MATLPAGPGANGTRRLHALLWPVLLVLSGEQLAPVLLQWRVLLNSNRVRDLLLGALLLPVLTLLPKLLRKIPLRAAATPSHNAEAFTPPGPSLPVAQRLAATRFPRTGGGFSIRRRSAHVAEQESAYACHTFS